MDSRIEGLEHLQKRLEEMAEKAEEMSGNHSVPISELLNPDFLASCSAFSNIEELFEASGFKVETSEDFAAIPESDWEWFIQQNTSYTSWHEMQQAAATIWMKKKLNW